MAAATVGVLVTVSLAVGGCSRTKTAPRPIASQGSPKRIVSLTPSNTEILFALGLGDRVIGVTKYCDYPSEARKKAKVGDVNISLEKVVSLKPDLVVAHRVLNDSIVGRLGDLGIPVLATDPKTFSEVESDIRLIGQRTGAETQATKLAKSMEDAVQSVKKRAVGGRGRRVLVVIQTGPLWAAGPKTFVDEMIGYAGGRNVAHDARPGFNTFSTEIAVTRNPDVIIVTRAADKAFFEHSAVWRRTNAVRSGKVRLIDPDLLLRPGPRLVQGLENLGEALEHKGSQASH